ncbi:MAG: hypothetical protein E7318_12030 [Clostridiales bacterium]|nr:hypothetical protein [Clostridiales bacterium]
MATVAYQCPNCASPLIYDGTSGKMVCTACDSQFDQEIIELPNTPADSGTVDITVPTEGYTAGDTAQLQAYNCKTCGAELITESTTTATECPYCGSPTILPDRIDGGIRPEMVVPFVITREQAQEMFHGYFKGKALLPNLFKKDNQIAEMRKLFVPCWLFDCEARGSVVYDAEKESSYTDGDEEVTEVEHYIVRRGGSMSFENIPVDGSVKMDDKISESLEPYNLTKAVAFTPAVLSGAMADHADVDADACEARAVNRATGSFKSALQDTIDGYTSISEKSSSVHVAGSKVTPVLLPVWLITTVKDGKTYTFAINGQTGRLTCNVPTAKGKAFLWGAVSFAGVLGLTALILHLTRALGSGTLLMAAIFALFVTIGIVGTMIGKLKQATTQSGASGYACEGGLNLTIESDSYRYTKQERKKIEKSAD